MFEVVVVRLGDGIVAAVAAAAAVVAPVVLVAWIPVGRPGLPSGTSGSARQPPPVCAVGQGRVNRNKGVLVSCNQAFFSWRRPPVYARRGTNTSAPKTGFDDA